MGKLEIETIAHEKYHFRYYRPSKNHPFLIVLAKIYTDENGKQLLSGFNMTHSSLKMLKRPNEFIKINNPNPNDDSECYVYVRPIKNKPLSLFSRPIRGWKLADEDEKRIDELVEKKLNIFVDDGLKSLDEK